MKYLFNYKYYSTNIIIIIILLLLLLLFHKVEAEPGMSVDARGKAKQYVKYLHRHDLMKFTHFMVDVVTVLSKVSLAAQVSNNTVAEVHVATSNDAAVATLSKYKTR